MLNFSKLWPHTFLILSCLLSFNSQAADKTLVDGLKGTWEGQIRAYKFLNGETNKVDDQGYWKIKIVNCNNDFQIWSDTDGKGYVRFDSAFLVSESKNNYILSAIYVSNTDAGWSETRSWSFIEGGNKASVNWSRIVSNPSLKENDPYFRFSVIASGEIVKKSSTCEVK